jgi:hypothetical protein
MTEAHQLYKKMLSALRAKTFERLVIKRLENQYYLIIYIDGNSHVFSDHAGKKKAYQHVWQIRNWLNISFEIVPDSIPVELIHT